MTATDTNKPWTARWEIGDDGPIHYPGNVRPCWNIYGPDRLVCSVEHFDGDDFPNAYAHLIAAAPDMAEALERMIHEFGDRGADDQLLPPDAQEPIVRDAMSALQKARGAQALTQGEAA